MRKIIEIKNLNNEIFVYWIITDFCNQHCTYCEPGLNMAYCASGLAPGFPTDSEIDIFVDKLIEVSKTSGRRLQVCISGGEPTLHNKIDDVITRLKPHGHIMIITNGTRSVTWWEQLTTLPDQVIITLHPEYYNDKKLRINNLSRFLIDNHVQLHYNLMCHPMMWDIVINIIDDLEDEFKPLIIAKIIQDQSNFSRKLYSYTSEQLDFIRTYPTKLNTKQSRNNISIYSDGTSSGVTPNKIMTNNEHFFFGWKCSAGSESISVFPNGDVRAGICSAKNLGKISNFKFLTEYLTCTRPSCVCPGDIELNKYNPKEITK